MKKIFSALGLIMILWNQVGMAQKNQNFQISVCKSDRVWAATGKGERNNLQLPLLLLQLCSRNYGAGAILYHQKRCEFESADFQWL